MTVAFDGRMAATDAGESGRVIRLVLETLAERYPECRFEIWLPGKKHYPLLERLLEKGNVRPRYPWHPLLRRFPSLWRRWGLAHDIRHDVPDIYHGIEGELPRNIRKIPGMEAVVSVSDLVFLSSPYSFRWSQRHLYNLRTRYACRHAARIIVPDSGTASDVVKYYFIPKTLISVVHPASDPVFSSPVTGDMLDKTRKKFSLPEHFIINVPSPDMKRTAGLVGKAMERFPCYGIVSMCASSGRFPENQIVISTASAEEQAAVYCMADAFICIPANPGFPEKRCLMDALCCGVPVIAADEPDLREIAGNMAWYVVPEDGDALVRAVHGVLSGAWHSSARYPGMPDAGAVADALMSVYTGIKGTE